jgi:hypothetical protein
VDWVPAVIFDSRLVVGRIGDILEGREISLPVDADVNEEAAQSKPANAKTGGGE